MAAPYRVGELNAAALDDELARGGIMLAARDVGGSAPRTFMLQVGTGAVTVNGRRL